MEQKKKPFLGGNKNFSLYISGVTVSEVGNVFSQFATSLFLMDLYGSAMPMSLYMAMNMLILIVFAPFMGVLVDRWNKVKIISSCDVLFGATEILLAALLFSGASKELILVGVFLNGFCNSTANSVFTPASSSMIPLITTGDERVQAYSQLSAVRNVTSVIGSLLAAGAYAVLGYKWILIFNGVTFLVSALLKSFIRMPYSPPMGTGKKPSFKAEFMQGINYTLGNNSLVGLFVVLMALNFFTTGIFEISVPFTLNVRLALHPMVLASLQSVMALGMITAATNFVKKDTAKYKNALKNTSYLLCGITVMLYVSIVLFISAPDTLSILWATLIGMYFILAVAIGRINIMSSVKFAAVIDKAYIGRVMAINATVVKLARPFASVFFGLLGDNSATGVPLVIAAMALFACTAYILRSKYFADIE